MTVGSRPPVVLFTFQRPIHVRLTLDALAFNHGADATSLFIYSDAARTEADTESVHLVRQELRKTRGFRQVEIVERPGNLGLAKNVILGVSEIIAAHGRAIVLEDDIVTAPTFLDYMSTALDAYADNPRIFSISGYNYPNELLSIPKDYSLPVYLSRRNSSWGWATWRDRWAQVDWDLSDLESFRRSRAQQKAFNLGGTDLTEMLLAQACGDVDSWAIRFSYAHFRNRAWAIYPVRSLTHNIGNDGSGMHCGDTSRYDVVPSSVSLPALPIKIEPDERILSMFTDVFSRTPLENTVAWLRNRGLFPRRAKPSGLK